LERVKPTPEGPREVFEELKRANDELGRVNEIGAIMEWMPFAPLAARPLISVVMPTRNRPTLLARAIASVQAQSYPNWELLVIDDASTDGTPALLSSLRSDAIRVCAGPGKGVCAARNIGLAAARGDLIAYLDDDNIMHPNWLKSVAWGFEQWPQSDALYGAFVIDNPARNGNPDGELPRLYFYRYDKLALTHSNIADMSAIAHRNGLPEARFDETLIGLGDWDLMLRLTRDKPPIALPVIACFYTTDAPDRLTFGPSLATETPIVQARSRR
jgi:glycosyltransferase involved in cell wall biosynthesis